MLKMFATQLSGLFNRIQDKEEFTFEDAARLLAQAGVSNSSIYMIGFREMEAVVLEATVGAEPFRFAKIMPHDLENALASDRAVLMTRYSTDADAISQAKQLQHFGIPFVAIATKVNGQGEEDLFDIADVSLNLQLTKGLLPDEDGNRFGYPAVMAALFAYYGLKFTYDEILAEYLE